MGHRPIVSCILVKIEIIGCNNWVIAAGVYYMHDGHFILIYLSFYLFSRIYPVGPQTHSHMQSISGLELLHRKHFYFLSNARQLDIVSVQSSSAS
jgi:hypothetical protein